MFVIQDFREILKNSDGRAQCKEEVILWSSVIMLFVLGFTIMSLGNYKDTEMNTATGILNHHR